MTCSTWPGAAGVVAGVLVLLHLGLSATPQAVDLLIALGQDGSVAAWLGLGIGTAWLALNAWFWSRFALTQPIAGIHHRRAATWMPCVLGAASLLAVADVLRAAAPNIPAGMGALGGGEAAGCGGVRAWHGWVPGPDRDAARHGA